MSKFFHRCIKSFCNRVGWHPMQDKAWKNRSSYEPEVRKLINKIVKNGWTCVDVGANIGIVTDMLTGQAGSKGLVVSFEAFIENVKQQKKYLAKEVQKGYVNVQNFVVSDGSHSHLWLYPGRNYAGGEWNIRGCDLNGLETKASLKVPATSLDAFFPIGQRIDFIKIDVEGAGDQVLAGAKRVIEQFRPIVLMEFHTDKEWKARKLLLSFGYKFYRLDGTSIPGDDDGSRVYLCYALPAPNENK